MNEDFYISLIYKQLTGDINAEDNAKLKEWIDASETNNATAEHVRIAWEQTANLTSKPEVNLDEAFTALSDRIEKEELKEKSSGEKKWKYGNLPPAKERNFKMWLGIAAGLLLGLVAAFVLKPYLDTPSDELVFSEVRTENNIHVITLPDKSTVKLNKNSYLKYPNQFIGGQRSISLEGEAFFEVMHDPAAPFIVKTQEGTVEVLGTSFNVRAYPEEPFQQVQVATGKVQVRIESTKEEVILTKGNQAIYDKENSKLEKMEEASDNNLSWHTGRLVFKNTPLVEVLQVVETVYEVDLDLENKKMANCMFNSTFENTEIETVIETISGVFGIAIEKENNRFILKGGQCE